MYSSPTERYDRSCHKADLAALAQTCQTFKDPALDILWEKLFDLSPLYLLLPKACKIDGCCSFDRPLSEAEWNILLSYTRRVRFICRPLGLFARVAILPSVPFTDPLFPNLRSLFWETSRTFPVEHFAVPSLTSLSLSLPAAGIGSLDTIGERCPNVKQFEVLSTPPGSPDATVSRQLCRWSNLQYADCHRVTLSMDTILHLPSSSTLKRLSFILSADLGNHITRLDSPLVFSDLTDLKVHSTSLKSVIALFSRVQLPKIKDLNVAVSEYTPRWAVQEYWTTIQRTCPSNTLARLTFLSIFDDANLSGLGEEGRPCLTLHDLLPYKDFGNLRTIEIDVAWSVNLTDSDVLDLVSTSPHLEELRINDRRGWEMEGEGGITLGGLVQLLRQCPLLGHASLVIDTRTFTQIPHGLDVSFPSRQTPRGTLVSLYCLDSKDNLHCEPVFKALKLDVRYGMDPRARL